MIVYLGADHRGFSLKEHLKGVLADKGYDVADLGNEKFDPADDYPAFASAVAEKVSQDPEESRGIVICGSGFGVDIVANKFDNVRAALAESPAHIIEGRHDDDVNVLALSAEELNENEAEAIAEAFLSTSFDKDEPRYSRRLDEISDIEKENK